MGSNGMFQANKGLKLSKVIDKFRSLDYLFEVGGVYTYNPDIPEGVSDCAVYGGSIWLIKDGGVEEFWCTVFAPVDEEAVDYDDRED